MQEQRSDLPCDKYLLLIFFVCFMLFLSRLSQRGRDSNHIGVCYNNAEDRDVLVCRSTGAGSCRAV